MKGYRKIMKAVAVILAFALIFSGMNVPGTALAATTAATAKKHGCKEHHCEQSASRHTYAQGGKVICS